METSLVVTLIVGLLATPLAAVATFMINRRRSKHETESVIVDSATHAVETMSEVMTRLREELKETRLELAETKQRLEVLIAQNERLTRENQQLRDRVDELLAALENN